MGMVEFSEPAAAAKAVRAWHNKRPYPKGKRLKVALWNKRPPNRRDSFGSRERSAELEELRTRVEAAERRAEAAEAARARACVAASELTALRGRNELRARAEDAEAASAAAPARAAAPERRVFFERYTAPFYCYGNLAEMHPYLMETREIAGFLKIS